MKKIKPSTRRAKRIAQPRLRLKTCFVVGILRATQLTNSTGVPVNHAAFHHKNNPAHSVNVFQGIAVKGNDVRLQPRRDRSDLISHAQGLSRERVGSNHSGHRLLAAVANAVDELFCVAPVGAGQSIGAKDDLQPLDLQSAREELMIDGNKFFHRSKAVYGGWVKRRAGKLLFVE